MNTTEKTLLLKNLNLICYIAMIAVNFLSNALPIGIGNTGSISARYPSLFTPAPMTFSIWGLIYLLMTYFIVYQYGILDGNAFSTKFVQLIGPFFILSCLLNIGWLFSWHYDRILLSMGFMVGLLITLMLLTDRLSPDYVLYRTAWRSIPQPAAFCAGGFSLYLGWITAAAIANMNVLIVKLEWNRFGISESLWTVLVLIIGTLIALYYVFETNRPAAAAAIVWAYFGILVRHISRSGYNSRYPLIIAAAAVCSILIIFIILIRYVTSETFYLKRS